MQLGYNTNGLAHHSTDQALEVLATIGYQSVAMTVDHHCLNPYAADIRDEISRLRHQLEQLQLSCVIETGARFLLDPYRKHQPTLVSPHPAERQRRREFLMHCIEMADDLRATAVSFWSGTPLPEVTREQAWEWLIEECRIVAEHAERRGVLLAFEPEPGMLVERMSDYERLKEAVGSPVWGLTLDVGHVHCLDDGSLPQRIREFADDLYNLHIEDMRIGEHEHLRFGDGTIDFPPLIAALRESRYTGPLHVELSRHSHLGPSVAAESLQFLRSLLST